MKTIAFLSVLFLAALGHGAELRVSSKEPVVVLYPEDWTATRAKPMNGAFPFEAYRLDPPTNRNAVCLISVLAKDRPEFTDPEFLKKLVRGDSKPYVSSPAELSKVDVKELKIESGAGYYANFTDTELVGKPTKSGSYKTATPMIFVISSKYLVKVTILCDEIDGTDYRDAMAIVKSLKVKKE